jgi:hypothetical protein
LKSKLNKRQQEAGSKFLLLVSFLLGLIIDLEDGGRTFLQNIGGFGVTIQNKLLFLTKSIHNKSGDQQMNVRIPFYGDAK